MFTGKTRVERHDNNAAAPVGGQIASSGVDQHSTGFDTGTHAGAADGAEYDQYAGNISYGAQQTVMQASKGQGMFSPFNEATPDTLLTSDELHAAADVWQTDYSHAQFQPCFQTQGYYCRYAPPSMERNIRSYGNGQPIRGRQ